MFLKVVTNSKLISHENANIRKVYFITAWHIYFFRIFSFNRTYLVIFLYNPNFFEVVYPHKMFRLN